MTNAGPSGQSVRAICKKSGADIKSWTEPYPLGSSRQTRAFIVEVDAHVYHHVQLICRPPLL